MPENKIWKENQKEKKDRKIGKKVRRKLLE